MKKLWLGALVLGSLLAQEQGPIEAKLTESKLDKNGILVGVDLGFGFGKGSAVATHMGTQDRVSHFLSYATNYDAKKFVVGYQKYSEKIRSLGMNVKGSVGLGNFQLKHLLVTDRVSFTRSPQGEKIVESFIPLTFGLEANFLYDFYEKGNNVVGLSLGLGYEFVHAFGAGVGFLNTTAANGTILSEYAPLFGNRGIDYFLLTPKLGLHYYYDRHQFGVDASFNKALNVGEVTYLEHVVHSRGDGASIFKSELSHFVTFGLNYAYRF